jgi:hypothetical protein
VTSSAVVVLEMVAGVLIFFSSTIYILRTTRRTTRTTQRTNPTTRGRGGRTAAGPRRTTRPRVPRRFADGEIFLQPEPDTPRIHTLPNTSEPEPGCNGYAPDIGERPKSRDE